MAARICITRGGARLGRAELDVLATGAREHGRATLLVPDLEARDACRRSLADAGLGIAVEAVAPAAWLAGLWELFGDARRIVSAVERQLLMAAVLDGHLEDEVVPLRANPGTVRMLARMAEALLPYAAQGEPVSDAERVIRALLAEYASTLDAHGLVEAAQAAEVLREGFSGKGAPACARYLALRDVDELPAHLHRLIATLSDAGEVVWLFDAERAACVDEVARVVPSRVERLDEGDALAAGMLAACATEDAPRFVEVAGPHAKARIYAEELSRLADAGAADIAVVSPCPTALFDEIAARLAARGLAARAEGFARFGETMAGRQLAALVDLSRRWGDALGKGRLDVRITVDRQSGTGMQAAVSHPSGAGARCDEKHPDVQGTSGRQSGGESASSWWPAPELADWLYCPLSGMSAADARQLDKKLRGNRQLTPEAVMRQLQSAQGRVLAERAKLDADHPYASVPAVCADVAAFVRQGRYVSALRSMLAVAEALPASAFGTRDGAFRAQVELTALRRALEVLTETAHRLDVAQPVALSVLDSLTFPVRMESAVPDARAAARIMTPRAAARLAPASVDAVFCADVDSEGYPLAHGEGALATLSAQWGVSPLSLEPIARLRSAFSHALVASSRPAVLARVTHDRQAAERYPSAIWTELQAARRALSPDVRPQGFGEGDIAVDLDERACAGMRAREAACLPPQELSPTAVPYLLPRRLDPSGSGELVPRLLSASQIEGYLGCPLCWFIGNRVRPQRLDAGFGGMEMGNFVHDVLYRFHGALIERGVPRVTRENVEDCLGVLREVFELVRGEHGCGKTDSSAPLVPLSASERMEVDRILPQMERVIRYEAGALAPFAPHHLEYSFNGLGVSFAGRPLGGRIDRVDVDAEGRAVVIDYKHRADADQFKVVDPTVPRPRTGIVPADDPDWLPEHTQALIYAQALRHSDLGLNPRAALYFSTKDRDPVLRGAASWELAEVEPGDGRIPGLKAGFPDEEHGGTCTFEELLDHVESVVRRKLDALEAGDVRAAEKPRPSCAYQHGLGFSLRRNGAHGAGVPLREAAKGDA